MTSWSSLNNLPKWTFFFFFFFFFWLIFCFTIGFFRSPPRMPHLKGRDNRWLFADGRILIKLIPQCCSIYLAICPKIELFQVKICLVVFVWLDTIAQSVDRIERPSRAIENNLKVFFFDSFTPMFNAHDSLLSPSHHVGSTDFPKCWLTFPIFKLHKTFVFRSFERLYHTKREICIWNGRKEDKGIVVDYGIQQCPMIELFGDCTCHPRTIWLAALLCSIIDKLFNSIFNVDNL
jgi:hypothetical protein